MVPSSPLHTTHTPGYVELTIFGNIAYQRLNSDEINLH